MYKEPRMWNFFMKIKSSLSLLIPAAMAAGILFGAVSADVSWLKQLILPLTIIMVLPMMIIFPMKNLFSNGASLKILIVNIVINFILFPLFVFGLGKLFFADNPGFLLGIYLLGLIPTSGMTISWTGFSGGNVKAAVSLTVIGLLSGALLAPLYLSVMLGAESSVKIGSIFLQILLVVFIPLLVGNLIRMGLLKQAGEKQFNEYWKKRIPTISSLGVLLIIFSALALKAGTLIKHPEQILIALVPILIFYAFSYALVTLIARLLFSGEGKSHLEGTALVFSTVMRNISIALAVAVTSFPLLGGEAALVLAVAYAVQVQSASLYVKHSGKFLGKTPAAAPAAG